MRMLLVIAVILVLALVIILPFCVNLWMLQRRFAPLEHLIDRIEEAGLPTLFARLAARGREWRQAA